MRKKQAFYIIVLIVSILFISVPVFYKYIFENYYFITKGVFGSDILRVNLPTYYQVYDSIKESGAFWNWTMGIGTSMFSHADVYFDPFNYILFAFGKDKITAMLFPMLLAKLLAEGIAFYSYVDSFHLNKWACIVTAIMYAFSGYSLIMGSNFVLGTILVYTPLVFLGIEKYLFSGKKKILFISLFLTCIYSYYFFFILGVLTAVYLLIRCKQTNQNPFIYLIRLAGMALMVIMLSMFALLPQIEIVLQSARVAGESDVKFNSSLLIPNLKVAATAIVRSIGSHLLGNLNEQYLGVHYLGNNDYFQVSCYSSFMFIILAWHYACVEKHRKKEIMTWGGSLLVIVLFPFFSLLLNAFSTINTRWMFILTVAECVLMAFSISSIMEKRKINMNAYLQGVVISVILIVISVGIICEGKGDQFLEWVMCVKDELTILVLLWIGLLIIALLYNNCFHKRSRGNIFFAYCVIILIAIDVFSNYYEWFISDSKGYVYSRNNPPEYEDESANAIHDLLNKDEALFRLYKNFDSVYDFNGIPSCNDAMAQNYFGLKSYNSLNNPQYIKFLTDAGIYVCNELERESYRSHGILPSEITGQSLNYITGVENDFSLFNYLGVKYYVAQSGTAEINEFYHLIYNENGIEIYENEAAYPLVFINEQTAPYSWFMTLPDNEKRKVLLEYTIIENDDMENFSPLETGYNAVNVAEKHQNNFVLNSFSPDKIEFQINVEGEAAYLNTSIPYDKDFHIYVDNMEIATEKINIAMLGAKVNKGQHMVTIQYFPKMFYTGLLFSVVTLFILIAVCVTCKETIELNPVAAIVKKGWCRFAKRFYCK